MGIEIKPEKYCRHKKSINEHKCSLMLFTQLLLTKATLHTAIKNDKKSIVTIS